MEKLIFFDTREVEPEATEKIIKSNSSKTGFNLKIQNNHLHCGDTPLQELQMQSIKQCNNKIVALLPAYNEEVSIGSMVLRNREHTELVINRPLYYFTVWRIIAAGLGIELGLGFLRKFYMGESLSFGLTLSMIMLTLIGTFMAFTGIILHSISMIYDLARSG